MSIQSEITRITNNVQDTIDVIEQTGVSVPAGANSDNLPSLAQALANEKQDKLTGSQGQFVGFTADNVVGAVDAPAGLPTGGTPGQMLYQGESGPEWGDKPVMVVNVSGAPNSGWTADKTFEEVKDAFDSGCFVYAKCVYPFSSEESAPLLIPLFYILQSQVAYFSSFMISGAIGFIIGLMSTGTCMVMMSTLSAGSIAFGPGTTGLAADNVQGAIEEVNAKIPAKPIYRTVTLTTSAWSSNTQTVTVQGVSATETDQLIQPVPAIASQAAYYAAGILCTNQAANSLTFTCQEAPSSDLTVYVVMQEVGA